MYNKIYDFCAVKNLNTCLRNGTSPTPRVNFLIDLIKSLSIEYELDTFTDSRDEERTERMKRIESERKEYLKRIGRTERERSFFGNMSSYVKTENNLFNIILPGSSNRMVVAHHDVVNVNSDNANDNSASCINAIALKLLVPSLNVVLLDGEEFGGTGSKRAASGINKGDFGSIEWVLNLELTGRGGDLFFIGNYPGKLTNHILSMFDCPIFDTPFNDSISFRGAGIDSTVINPLPVKASSSPYRRMPRYNINRNYDMYGNDDMYEHENDYDIMMNGKKLDTDILMLCHSQMDSLDKISTRDMKVFVEDVLYKIVTS